MPPFNQPLHLIIQQRYSCRTYNPMPVDPGQIGQLSGFTELVKTGPLGTSLRFELAVAMGESSKELRGLGTYGLIKNPAGFIIGAMGKDKKNLEEFGYGMEAIILYATSLGLGTCWLGGNFTKSSFSRRIQVQKGERVPAVASFGCPAEGSRTQDRLRQKVQSDQRFPWETLFFRSSFSTPLSPEKAGNYALPLEMLRMAPSSHNYQPWRIVQDSSAYHFYLQRTPGFGPGTPMFILLGIADLQRLEIGIAMCHFEQAARELNLPGKWVVCEPDVQKPYASLEYVVSWIGI